MKTVFTIDEMINFLKKVKVKSEVLAKVIEEGCAGCKYKNSCKKASFTKESVETIYYTCDKIYKINKKLIKIKNYIESNEYIVLVNQHTGEYADLLIPSMSYSKGDNEIVYRKYPEIDSTHILSIFNHIIDNTHFMIGMDTKGKTTVTRYARQFIIFDNKDFIEYVKN